MSGQNLDLKGDVDLQAMFASARNVRGQIVDATQIMPNRQGIEVRVAYLRKTAAFKAWLEHLKLGDRLPRGKFFEGKLPGRPLMIMDEFASYI